MRLEQRDAPVQRQVIHMIREEHRYRRTPSEDVEGDPTAIGHSREPDRRSHRWQLYAALKKVSS
jgi:hypothetical protein